MCLRRVGSKTSCQGRMPGPGPLGKYGGEVSISSLGAPPSAAACLHSGVVLRADRKWSNKTLQCSSYCTPCGGPEAGVLGVPSGSVCHSHGLGAPTENCCPHWGQVKGPSLHLAGNSTPNEEIHIFWVCGREFLDHRRTFKLTLIFFNFFFGK